MTGNPNFEHAGEDEAQDVRYAPVVVSKFVLLYLTTFGLYGLIWF
jgi:hypothetical protein